MPIGVFSGLSLAIFVDRFSGAAATFLRAVLLLPFIMPLFLTAAIWLWLMVPQFGLFNQLTSVFGLGDIDWLSNPRFMVPALVIVETWRTAGFNMLLFYAGLKAIPRETLEAARIDGANTSQEIYYIILPQIAPITFIIAVNALLWHVPDFRSAVAAIQVGLCRGARRGRRWPAVPGHAVRRIGVRVAAFRPGCGDRRDSAHPDRHHDGRCCSVRAICGGSILPSPVFRKPRTAPSVATIARWVDRGHPLPYRPHPDLVDDQCRVRRRPGRHCRCRHAFIPPRSRGNREYHGSPCRWQVHRGALTNSVIYASLTAVLVLALASAAAYEFAHFRFPGRDFLYVICLLGLMLPLATIIIPAQRLVVAIGWLNTVQGMVVPTSASAFALFFLTEYMRAVPKELFEAARIDGASHFGIYWRIALPVVRNGLLTVGILIFIMSWASYLWPLVVATNSRVAPISVHVAGYFMIGSKYPTNIVMTAAMLSAIPVVAFYIAFNRLVVDGIARSGITG